MNYSEVSAENQEYYRLFERCNKTELYQLARSVGFSVPPTASKDQLIRILIYEDTCTTGTTAIDDWRYAIMGFLIDHRRVLETQITCPAKSFEETACFACVDAQVVHCLSTNGSSNFKLIELHKKNRSAT